MRKKQEKRDKRREGWRKDKEDAKKRVKGSDEIEIADRKSEMIKFRVNIGKEGEGRSFYREKDF